MPLGWEAERADAVLVPTRALCPNLVLSNVRGEMFEYVVQNGKVCACEATAEKFFAKRANNGLGRRVIKALVIAD
jgi:hypothetical protein